MFADGNATNWGAISTDGADPDVQAFGRPSVGLITFFIGHVRFWPKADMGCCTAHVRFRGKADLAFCGCRFRGRYWG